MARSLRDQFWWDKDAKKDVAGIASDVFAVVSGVESAAAQPRARALLFASFAAGRPFGDLHFGFGYSMSSNRGASWAFDPSWSAPSQNVIRISIQTLQSTIGASQPFVNFLTDGADFAQSCAAKRGTRFVDAVYEEQQTYKETKRSFRDLLVFGTAYCRVLKRADGSIGTRRVLPDNIWVDPIDAHAWHPRTMYERRFISKEELIADFPQFADDITASSPPFPFLATPQTRYTTDMTVVVEAFHLPTRGKPGRHVISIGKVLLLDEPWKHDFFPYAVGRFNELHAGWHGQGLVEQLLPMQVELDYLGRQISDSHRRLGHPFIINPIASGIPDDHFIGRNGRIVRPSSMAEAPKYMVPEVMPPESYAREETMIQRMFKEAGVSELAAAALKPRGLDSGEALREYADQASMRFQDLGKTFEQFHEDIAKLIVALAQDGDAKTMVLGRQLSWSEVKWDGSPLCKAYPVSTLPMTPAARKQTIEEDFQKGSLAVDDYLRLRNNPDLGAWISEATAARVLIEQQLDSILETGRYEPPTKYQDLATAARVGVQRWNLAMIRKYDSRRMGLISRYCDDATKKLQAATSPPPQMAPSAQPVAAMVPAGSPVPAAAPMAA